MGRSQSGCFGSGHCLGPGQNVICAVDYKQQKFISCSSGGCKSPIKVLADSTSGQGLSYSSETVSLLRFSE